MAQAPDFNKARADYHRVAASCDASWNAYRKARERLAKQKGRFAAEQGFIDASAAVGRAQARLAEKETLLRSAAFKEAERNLLLAARARVPFKAPTLEEKRAEMENLVLCATRSPGV